MKQKIKVFLLIITLSAGFGISCENTETTPVNSKEALTSKILASEKFESLNISLGKLDIENSVFTTSKKDAVVIPSKINGETSGVIALFDKNYTIRTVMYFNVATTIESGAINSAFIDGTFNGEMEFRNEYVTTKFTMINSKVINKKAHLSALVAPSCSSFSLPGGALDCAGARIANMNFVDATFCYATFIYCLAQEVASCYADGCVVNPS